MPVASWAVLSTGLWAAFATVRRAGSSLPHVVLSPGEGEGGPRGSAQTLGHCKYVSVYK